MKLSEKYTELQNNGLLCKEGVSRIEQLLKQLTCRKIDAIISLNLSKLSEKYVIVKSKGVVKHHNSVNLKLSG
jgi:hypothetical protein